MDPASLGDVSTLKLPDRNGTDERRRAARITAACPGPSHAPEWIGLGEGHPLHLVDRVVREALRETRGGAIRERDPEAPDPERLIRSLLLQILYSLDCDRRLLEQLRYDLRFRWFAGLADGERVWSQAAHAGARDALLRSGTGRQLFGELLRGLRPVALTWPEDFSFDERLVDRWQADLGRPAPAAEAAGLQQGELLRAAGFSCSGDQADARLVRALEWILPRICEPDLNCEALAAEIGMSRRALYYLFDAHGLTPAVAIRNIRLEHCKRLLEDARHGRRKITAIALDHGFVNICTFSRSFKQRYGIGPRDCRTFRRARNSVSRP